MIRYIKRKDLDVVKYNNCIKNSLQSRIFAFSWYLDIVADNWDTLVLEDYEAVMPIPWRKKYFIKYIYQPLWTLELGVFSKEVVDENEFLIVLLGMFKYINIRTNVNNSFSMFEENRVEKYFQKISFQKKYKDIYRGYNRNRKRELTKAIKNDLIERWNDDPENLVLLFKTNVGKRVLKIKEPDYIVLLKLITTCLMKKKGEILSIYDRDNNLVSSAFFIKYKEKITEIVCSSDFKNRKNGANTFLNDRAIYKYQPNFKSFNFGGSSIDKIAKYYKSFGAETENYQQIKYNNLPKVIQFFKH